MALIDGTRPQKEEADIVMTIDAAARARPMLRKSGQAHEYLAHSWRRRASQERSNFGKGARDTADADAITRAMGKKRRYRT